MAEKLRHSDILAADNKAIDKRLIRKTHPNILQMLILWMINKTTYGLARLIIVFVSFFQSFFLPIPVAPVFFIFSLRHRSKIPALAAAAFFASLIGSALSIYLSYSFPQFIQKLLYYFPISRTYIFSILDIIQAGQWQSISTMILMPIPDYFLIMTVIGHAATDAAGFLWQWSNPAIQNLTVYIIANSLFQVLFIGIINYILSHKIIYVLERYFNSVLLTLVLSFFIVFMIWKVM